MCREWLVTRLSGNAKKNNSHSFAGNNIAKWTMQFKKDKCSILVEDAGESGLKTIEVVPDDPSAFISKRTCTTAYPMELIELILKIKGPYGLCDEIMRDEKPDYVQISLHYDLLAYIDEAAFAGARILDFGCGSGASTAILGRMFPHSQVVGLELNASLLDIARARAKHYELSHVTFEHSLDPLHLPEGLGRFDFIVLSAVFEHLLPQERRGLFPKIWSTLKPGGTLFINQTPHRFFPVETHTTGLPFINYLPDKLAYTYARRFSKRNLKNADWSTLLRGGIRGTTPKEIMNLLADCQEGAVLLEPSHLGIKNRLELWYIKLDRSKYPKLKELYAVFARLMYSVGILLLPHVSIAIQKKKFRKEEG